MKIRLKETVFSLLCTLSMER